MTATSQSGAQFARRKPVIQGRSAEKIPNRSPTTASGREPVATNGCFGDVETGRRRSEHRAALEKPEGPLWVETTPWRTAAYRHRTFKVGFLAMNFKGRRLLGILDRASSLRDRENTHYGPSGTDFAGCTPPPDARRVSLRQHAPDYPRAAAAPPYAGPSQFSTRARPTHSPQPRALVLF